MGSRPAGARPPEVHVMIDALRPCIGGVPACRQWRAFPARIDVLLAAGGAAPHLLIPPWGTYADGESAGAVKRAHVQVAPPSCRGGAAELLQREGQRQHAPDAAGAGPSSPVVTSTDTEPAANRTTVSTNNVFSSDAGQWLSFSDKIRAICGMGIFRASMAPMVGRIDFRGVSSSVIGRMYSLFSSNARDCAAISSCFV